MVKEVEMAQWQSCHTLPGKEEAGQVAASLPRWGCTQARELAHPGAQSVHHRSHALAASAATREGPDLQLPKLFVHRRLQRVQLVPTEG